MKVSIYKMIVIFNSFLLLFGSNTEFVKEKYIFPSEFNWKDAPINIYISDKGYETDFDVSNCKNTGGKAYYVGLNGNDKNKGTSKRKPFRTVLKAYTVAQSKDSIILLDGVYSQEDFLNGKEIKKSINIVAKNNNKVILGSFKNLTYKKLKGQKIYVCNTEEISEVIDLINYNTNLETLRYEKADSINMVSKTKGSWYYSNGCLYIRTIDDSKPTKKRIVSLSQSKSVTINSSSENVKVYLEGVTVLGGANAALFISNSTDYSRPEIYAKNCIFRFAQGNAVSVLGARYAFFQNCEASYSNKDGFNYHAQNSTTVKSIEVNCIGKFNGCNTGTKSDNTYNGSTTHDGNIAIRLNCEYFSNVGTNVADVNINTQSINLGCSAYDSKADYKNYCANFSAQQSGTQMWLDRCTANDSYWDLYTVPETTIYVNNSIYSKVYEGGTVEISSY